MAHEAPAASCTENTSLAAAAGRPTFCFPRMPASDRIDQSAGSFCAIGHNESVGTLKVIVQDRDEALSKVEYVLGDVVPVAAVSHWKGLNCGDGLALESSTIWVIPANHNARRLLLDKEFRNISVYAGTDFA